MMNEVNSTSVTSCCAPRSSNGARTCSMISALSCCLPSGVLISDAFLLDNSSSKRLRTLGILFLMTSTSSRPLTCSVKASCRYCSPFSGCRLTVNGSIVTYTVNLQPENGEQYLQLAFTLQVSGLEEVEVIKNNMPKVRSRLLLLLSSKKASDINTPEGKQQLSAEIMEQVRAPFEERGAQQDVTEVLFTSFIIQ